MLSHGADYVIGVSMSLGLESDMKKLSSIFFYKSRKLSPTRKISISEIDAYDMDELVMNMKFFQHRFRLYLSENYSRTVSVGAGIEAEFVLMYSLYDAVDKDYQLVNTLGPFAYIRFYEILIKIQCGSIRKINK